MPIFATIFAAAADAKDGFDWLKNHIDKVSSLDDQRREVNQRNMQTGMSVLDYAARTGSKDTVEFLIYCGAILEYNRNEAHRSVLYWSMYNSDTSIRDFLLQPDIFKQIKLTTSLMQADLYMACAAGDSDGLGTMVESPDIDFFAKDTSGATIFTYIITGMHQLLLQQVLTSRQFTSADPKKKMVPIRDAIEACLKNILSFTAAYTVNKQVELTKSFLSFLLETNLEDICIYNGVAQCTDFLADYHMSKNENESARDVVVGAIELLNTSATDNQARYVLLANLYYKLSKIYLELRQYDSAIQAVWEQIKALAIISSSASPPHALLSLIGKMEQLKALDCLVVARGLHVSKMDPVKSIYDVVSDYVRLEPQATPKNLYPRLLRQRVSYHLERYCSAYQPLTALSREHFAGFITDIKTGKTKGHRFELLALSREFNLTFYALTLQAGRVVGVEIMRQTHSVATVFIGTIQVGSETYYVSLERAQKQTLADIEIEQTTTDAFDPNKMIHSPSKKRMKGPSSLKMSFSVEAKVDKAVELIVDAFAVSKNNVNAEIRSAAERGDVSKVSTLIHELPALTDEKLHALREGLALYYNACNFYALPNASKLTTLTTLEGSEGLVEALPVMDNLAEMFRLIPTSKYTSKDWKTLACCYGIFGFITSLLPAHDEMAIGALKASVQCWGKVDSYSEVDFRFIKKSYSRLMTIYIRSRNFNQARILQEEVKRLGISNQPDGPAFQSEFSQTSTITRLWGYKPVFMPMDGNCQFAALVNQLEINSVVEKNELTPMHLRQQLVGHMKDHTWEYAEAACMDKDCDYSDKKESTYEKAMRIMKGFNRYLQLMRNDGVWGDELTLSAFSRLYNMNIVVIYHDDKFPRVWRRFAPVGTAILLFEGNHYSSLVPDFNAKQIKSIAKYIKETEIDAYRAEVDCKLTANSLFAKAPQAVNGAALPAALCRKRNASF